MKQNLLGDWFERQAAIIHEEAAAKLFQHGGLVGNVREFVIKSVLKRFLPDAVTIGAGQAFDVNGNMSRQIDIIIADNRFPVLRSADGCNLYPIESVIATLEIKSCIDSFDGLSESMANCHSILQLACQWRSSHEIAREISSGRADGSRIRLYRKFGFSVIPSTYVFSFSGTSVVDSLRSWVQSYYADAKFPFAAGFPRLCESLPRMILCGDLIGILNDGKISIRKPEQSDGSMPLMLFGAYEHRFSLLMSHILDTVCSRIGTESQNATTRFDVSSLLPITNCFNRISELISREHSSWSEITLHRQTAMP